MNNTIGPEDYIEPRCPLECRSASGTHIQSIPQRRVLDKLDEYLSRRDYFGAERHLLYWREEARQGGDLQGQLLICNELIGHYRKNDHKDKAIAAIKEAVGLLEALNYSNQLSAGTTYVNIATAYSAFGEDEEAFSWFSRAKAIYEAIPGIESELLGGLYNNMGLCCAALGRFSEAHALYALAMEQMKSVSGRELEQAITCLNMADAWDAEQGRDICDARIRELLTQARELLLESSVERDGYYAFVCEKCAAGFLEYGDRETAERLKELAEQIYDRT